MNCLHFVNGRRSAQIYRMIIRLTGENEKFT
jgi:hypothetical protein